MRKRLRHTRATRGPRSFPKRHAPISAVTIEHDAESSLILRTSMRSSRGMTEVSIAIGKDDFPSVLATMMAVDRTATLDALLHCRANSEPS